MNWIEEANKNDEVESEILSYTEYMNLFEDKFKKECRPTYEYLIDMINYFGQTEDGHYKVFQNNHNDSPPVYGQLKTQKLILQNLINFQEEGFNNKFILLVGPNGSAKSSIIRKLMKGAEEYSKTKEGALYTFSWVFPIDNYIKGTLGLTSQTSGQELASYAHLEDKDVNAILPSEMRDHPLLLVPIEYRQKLIDDVLKNDPILLDSVKKSYLYKGDLSKRNKMVYDALLKNYKGNHSEVLKHIRVERFSISKRYSTGAVTIEPQLHVDAKMQQITMDKRLASLPPSLQSLNLFQMQGEIVMANRGILEYSDLLKRPLDTFKYLLMTMETANINLAGIQTELDIFFIGTSNEIHLTAFKQHPDFNSFKGRFNFIRVPYLLNYLEEEKIYEEQIDGLKDKATFEPFALRAICLFAVMSRLRCSQAKHFEDKTLSKIISDLNPLQKAELYCSKEVIPENLDTESKQILKMGIPELKAEFEFENLYEGKFGMSPRDIKNIIYKLSSDHNNISFIDVLDYFKQLITKKNEYDFLNMTPQGDFHHPARFIALIKIMALENFDSELRSSLGLIDDRSYNDYIRKYINHINSMIKGEKIKNEITGKYEPCDEYFIKEFESNLNLKEDPSKYRSFLISKLGAYYLDNPNKQIDYSEVFPDLIKALQESFRNEQKKVIQNISKNLVFYEAEIADSEKSTSLSEKDRNQIDMVISNLVDKFKYSRDGAINLLKYIIKEKY